jgi:hypothetical protein
MLILIVIIIFFFTWSFYKNQLYMIRYGPNVENVEDLEGNRKVYLKSMFEDDNRKSAYYYAMAAKYYALAGDYLMKLEQQNEIVKRSTSNTQEVSNDDQEVSNDDQEVSNDDQEVSNDDQEVSNDDQEVSNDDQEVSNKQESNTNNEPSNEEVDELVSMIRKRTSNKILESLNDVSDTSMKDLISLVEGDNVNLSKMQNTFSKLAEDMLGSKIENITELIPPNAFEDAIKTLQSLSESFKTK